MVEFPFAVLILILMLIIVADLGRLTPWAQQVAYATDAGAQFAYRRYSLNGAAYRVDTTGDSATFAELETAVKQHIQSAVSGIEIDGDDIEVNQIWRCRTPNFSGGVMTVNYGAESTSPLDGNDCGGIEPARFIEVVVTDVFEPLTPYIERIMPQDLREQTFRIRRQIFPR
ncbi:MAG: hypothetical protein VBE63_13010 [Lamprobacter sp.]|uniref:hypothetical protein n=1 Tax=Lamprobacter sp. TaxID=3100796 RepID=UPI002B25F374|nr:hypothetical protein [Lamprobacter sp.]MEA3640848.1 hypothetical protein [Lamprobacter sp.]